ncbi:GNAT family N-acetyltransferase [Streptomyces sp. NPDC050610]|uniref:GNAT family N-acetyltransferase n=1 Tax=Streptomyces sp. NPDC050610 TaxID=3157097 RepID=UPI0034301997
MPDVTIRRAGVADRPAVERLWLMFRHDLSEFDGLLPGADGTFPRNGWLDKAFCDPDWAPYLLTSGGSPAGFAFVRSLDAPTRVLNTFFVARGARRTGIGLRAVQEIVARHPGAWEVAFQDANVAAVRFWRRVATQIAGDAWSEQRRPIPGRPELTPDVWISFSVLGEAAAAESHG